MDRSGFKKKVLLDLVNSTWVLLPVALGASLLLGAWAVEGATNLLGFLGVSSLLAGVGVLATRWVTGHDKIARKVFEEMQTQAVQQEEQVLEDLHGRLEQDNDPRTGESLRMLRDLSRRIKAMKESGAGHRPPVEIATKVEKLVQSCIMSLERSLTLWETAQGMMTDEARQSVLKRREQILEEVKISIDYLARTLDGVQALGLDQRQDRKLASIRRELDESLDVARRVEERLQSLEADLEGGFGEPDLPVRDSKDQ